MPADEAAIGCAFGPVTLHHLADGPLVHDLAMLADDAGAWLAFSERGGLFLVRLDRSGEAAEPARRLGPACPGGLALARGAQEVRIACGRPADVERGLTGQVVLLDLEGSVQEVHGPMGESSRGVALHGASERWELGWQHRRGWIADALLLREDTAAIDRLGSGDTLAGRPYLFDFDGELAVLWSESWVGANGRVDGNLLLQRGRGVPRIVASVAEIDPRPSMVTDGHDGWLLTYRARPSRGATRLHVQPLDRDLRPRGEASLPSRADAPEAEPSLIRCGAHLFALTARRSSRGVTMVTVRRLDEALRPAAGEHQIYEYGTTFPNVRGACVGGDRLLLAFGERATHVSPTPRVRTTYLECGAGVAHTRTPSIEGQVGRETYRPRF